MKINSVENGVKHHTVNQLLMWYFFIKYDNILRRGINISYS